MHFYANTTYGRHIVYNVWGGGLADGISGALFYDKLPDFPE
jgi:hypothetical protein